jgi:subtilase family serine protease
MLAGVAIGLAATPSSARPGRVIDDNDRVTLRGNKHPRARAEFDRGAAPASLPMERMILALRREPRKQTDLDRYLADLHDPASPAFHRWLTPEEFGARFGPTAEDRNAVVIWLKSHGFTIDEIARSGDWINFSGAAQQVERAFRTPIHSYFVNGRIHHANDRDPEIPRGLSDIVAGIVTLHDFPRKTMHSVITPVEKPGISPQYTAGSIYYLSPSDFAVIYNVNAIYNAGIDGGGQSIAIVGRTNPPGANWATFRSMMALPSNSPQVIVNGPDPGDLGPAENAEADLDVEWSGAVARNALIKFVTSKSTFATDGVDLSAQYIVNNNLSPVMSTSFGACEAELGSAENIFYNNLWQQASAQGITSFVASGDSGASGCDPGDAASGTGLGVNGLGSTPHNIAVGGTQFNEGTGTYWSTTNGPGYSSALSYIPEIAWNESGSVSGGSGLWSTGGGSSSRYAKPSWQAAPGVPVSNTRHVPDISLTAAGHVAYLVQTGGALYAVKGTSASSPAFAGLMALVVQKTGQRQGNANFRFYQLGNAQFGSGGVPVFHDVASGSNSVPGVTGYASTTGYDRATGLGSVDAAALVNNWTPDFTITAAPTALTLPRTSAGTSTITTAVLGNFSNAVVLSASGLPTGVTADFSPNPVPAPGSGSSTMTLTIGASSPLGTFPVTVTSVGGSITHSTAVTLVIAQTYTITSSVNGGGGTIIPASASVVGGGNAVLTITPMIGYHLTSLIDNGMDVTASVTNGTYTLMNVTANHTLIATFGINSYTVAGSIVVGSGTISPTSASIHHGNPATFTLTPASGYTLGGLTDNGIPVSATENPRGTFIYTITSVTENHAVQASFVPAVVSVPAIEGGSFLAAVAVLGALIGMNRRCRLRLANQNDSTTRYMQG